MLMLLCATTAVARVRLGVSVGCSTSSCSLGLRHRSVRCSSATPSAQGGDSRIPESQPCDDAAMSDASAQGGDDERLMAWFTQNGGSGSVAVAAEAGLRGLVVTRDVQVGDMCLSLTHTSPKPDPYIPDLYSPPLT